MISAVLHVLFAASDMLPGNGEFSALGRFQTISLANEAWVEARDCHPCATCSRLQQRKRDWLQMAREKESTVIRDPANNQQGSGMLPSIIDNE